MKEIKNIIAENIVSLRKKQKWTQAELAERLNFTDKAISKWERAESTPDADSLLRLSQIFNVTVDYFFHEEQEDKKEFINPSKESKIRSILLCSMFCIASLFISLAIFCFATFKDPNNASTYWVSFIWMVFICSFIVFIYFRKNKNLTCSLITTSLSLWSLATAIYFHMLFSELNFWMIFLICIPIQAALVIGHFMKK